MFWTTPKGRAAKPRTYFVGRGLQPRGSAPKDGRDLTLNVLTERMQIIAREKYHHEEHEGHKVKSECKILRDLRGRQILLQVTGADGLAELIRLPQLSFGVWLGSWEQTSRGPWALADGFVVSSAERGGPLGFLRAHTFRN